MSGENQGKVIFGRDEICKAYNIGRRTFRWLLDKGAPIKRVADGRYVAHRESLDQFILLMTLDNDSEKAQTKEKPEKRGA